VIRGEGGGGGPAAPGFGRGRGKLGLPGCLESSIEPFVFQCGEKFIFL